MRVSEEQARLICERVIVKRPCPNCEFDGKGQVHRPLKVVELNASLLSTKENDDEEIIPFALWSCPNCGITSFINLKELGVL